MEDISASTPRSSTQITEEEPIGFEDDAMRIIQLLTRGTRELDIVSIVGMPGLGKTTLAKKIFNNPSISSHFDMRLWGIVSQSYDVQELLRVMYRQVRGVKCNVDDERSVLADMLRKCLMSKRYLIVLDDLWEVKAWEELQLSFPKEENGSRIIITSRLQQVAEQVKMHSDPYRLRFMTTEESWMLLQRKVFQKETCPTELRNVGQQVAKYCGGLPLTIVLISGVLIKNEWTVLAWHEIANRLKLLHVRAVEFESNSTILFSYLYLPVSLRYCLLTTGVFKEDENIKASKLMLLWMAEGFVQHVDEGRLMEEIAEGYLMDLISSSLVMVSKTTSSGKVKYLQIHDLVRDFCLKKAKEEKFMEVIGRHHQYQPSYDGERRLCIHIDKEKLVELVPRTGYPSYYGEASLDNLVCDDLEKGITSLGQNLTSLFVNSVWDEYKQSGYNFSRFGDFRLLRVLDFMDCYLKDYENVLRLLLQLRYLSMRVQHFSFKSVSHLHHLETLLLKNRGDVTETQYFWKLSKLRHIKVEIEFHLPIEEHTSKMENLRTFKRMVLYYDTTFDMEEFIERLPKLQKLSLYVRHGYILPGYIKSDLFLNLQALVELQALELRCIRRITTFDYFPKSLTKLILRNIDLTMYATPTLARLPYLENLTIIDTSFDQQEWDVRDVVFPVLKILKFDYVNLMQWHASETSFPMIEILNLTQCVYLEEIPSSFMDVQTLKLIIVQGGQKSLEDLALNIKEEAEAITGNDNLKVLKY